MKAPHECGAKVEDTVGACILPFRPAHKQHWLICCRRWRSPADAALLDVHRARLRGAA